MYTVLDGNARGSSQPCIPLPTAYSADSMTTHASPDLQAYYAARAPYYDAVYLKPERQADIAFL